MIRDSRLTSNLASRISHLESRISNLLGVLDYLLFEPFHGQSSRLVVRDPRLAGGNHIRPCPLVIKAIRDEHQVNVFLRLDGCYRIAVICQDFHERRLQLRNTLEKFLPVCFCFFSYLPGSSSSILHCFSKLFAFNLRPCRRWRGRRRRRGGRRWGCGWAWRRRRCGGHLPALA